MPVPGVRGILAGPDGAGVVGPTGVDGRPTAEELGPAGAGVVVGPVGAAGPGLGAGVAGGLTAGGAGVGGWVVPVMGAGDDRSGSA